MQLASYSYIYASKKLKYKAISYYALAYTANYAGAWSL